MLAGLVTGATARCFGGPSEDALVAALQLADQPNYSWTVTVADDVQAYTIDGKTRREGWSWVRLPMIAWVAQRIGREAGTNLEAIFRGNADGVVRTRRGWQKLGELPRYEVVTDDEAPFPELPSTRAGARSSSPGLPGDPFVSDPASPWSSSPPARPTVPADPGKGYSNAQFGVSPPHQELAIIVGSYVDLHAEGDEVTGTLDDAGARLLLVRDGQKDISPELARGDFRLRLQDGAITSYLLVLQGVLEVNGPRGRQRVLVNQKSNTIIRNVGTTEFQVPVEAYRKLGP